MFSRRVIQRPLNIDEIQIANTQVEVPQKGLELPISIKGVLVATYVMGKLTVLLITLQEMGEKETLGRFSIFVQFLNRTELCLYQIRRKFPNLPHLYHVFA